MQVFKIDDFGFYIEPVIVDKNEPIPTNCIEFMWESALYKPKWNGEKWIEGATQEEIDDYNNQPYELPELEMLMLAIADLDMQREIDKTETQLAVAEIAETLLGGM